jgi:hypothetical protein
MSVPVNQRSHGKLEACVKAHDLCCYTLQITSNKKVFTTEYQESLTNRIVQSAIEIHTLCWSANNVLVKTKDDRDERLAFQRDAAVQCNVLLSLIEIAKRIFHLSTKRVLYWSNLTIEARNLIRAWRESDKKRYSGL